MIRDLLPGDLTALLPLVVGLADHHGEEARVSVGTLFREFFGDPRWLHGIVAAEEDGLSGYAALLPRVRLHRGDRGMDLHHLFVRPEARGRGLGRGLVRAALDHAQRQGCAYMTVTAHPANLSVQGFYRAQGFQAAPPAPDRFAYDLSAVRPAP